MHSAALVTLAPTVFTLVASSVNARTITVKNNCQFSLDTRATGNPAPSQGQWNAAPGSTNQIQVADVWNGGRVWALPPGGPEEPKSLFEPTLNGNDKDFYNLSLVDGFNLPLLVTSSAGCPSRTCENNLNPNCPDNMRVKDGNGNTVACRNQDANYFKAGCPEAYSWSGDSEVVRSCPGDKHSDYFVQFC